jgi:DNA-binding IclR family transcriptional regulator
MPFDKARGHGMKERTGIQSVEVGFALVQALANATQPLMLRDLAQLAGMNAAKAHRYLVSYQRLGLVLQDPHSTRYDLGPTALKLGLASLSRLDAVSLARARCTDLLGVAGQVLAVAVWGNRGPVIVHWAEALRSVTVNLRLGDVMPLLSSATGRCFAAFEPPELVRPLLQAELKAAARQPRTGVPSNTQEANALLAQVRLDGIARADGSLIAGIVGFCAPVFDSSGRLIVGLVGMGSASHMEASTSGAQASALMAAAQALSCDLGYAA